MEYKVPGIITNANDPANLIVEYSLMQEQHAHSLSKQIPRSIVKFRGSPAQSSLINSGTRVTLLFYDNHLVEVSLEGLQQAVEEAGEGGTAAALPG